MGACVMKGLDVGTLLELTSPTDEHLSVHVTYVETMNDHAHGANQNHDSLPQGWAAWIRYAACQNVLISFVMFYCVAMLTCYTPAEWRLRLLVPVPNRLPPQRAVEEVCRNGTAMRCLTIGHI